MPPHDARPIIVSGMHRSGVSRLGAYLARCGVVAGDAASPGERGTLDDPAVRDLDRRIMRAATRDEPGHRDWGFTVGGAFDAGAAAAVAAEADALVRRRIAGGGRWGFADPCASLLLEFWERALAPAGGALWVLVYRHPWRVLRAITRGGPAGGLHRPDWLYPLWCRYNRALLDFARAHPRDAVLISIDGAARAPAELARLVAERCGLAAADGDGAAEPLGARAGTEGGDHRGPGDEPDGDRRGGADAGGVDAEEAIDRVLAELVPAAWPECGGLLAALDERADLPSGGEWRRSSPRARRRLQPPAPDVSIVIPCRDDGEYVIEAVASVAAAAETDPNHAVELVVVDDRSTAPATMRILTLLTERGFGVRRAPGSGLGAARAGGLAAARGRFLLALAAGDRLRADWLHAAVARLEADPAIAIVIGDVADFGERVGRRRIDEPDPVRLLESPVEDGSALFRREVGERLGGYDEALAPCGEWDFWLRALEHDCRFARLDLVALEHRVADPAAAARARAGAAWQAAAARVVGKHAALVTRHAVDVVSRLHARIAALEASRRDLEAERARAHVERDRERAEIARLGAELDRLRGAAGPTSPPAADAQPGDAASSVGATRQGNALAAFRRLARRERDG